MAGKPSGGQGGNKGGKVRIVEKRGGYQPTSNPKPVNPPQGRTSGGAQGNAGSQGGGSQGNSDGGSQGNSGGGE